MARYGLRFAAAFAAVGFEDLDDLMLCCPSASVVAGVLKGAGAHKPQLYRILSALVDLTGELLPADDPADILSKFSAARGFKPSASTPLAKPSLPGAAKLASLNPHTGDGKGSTPQAVPAADVGIDANAAIAPTLSTRITPAPIHTAATTVHTSRRRRRARETLSPVLILKKSKKHVMLSYQWDHQDVVKQMRLLLEQRGIRVWMDLGDMTADIYDSMAEGVQGAICVVACMSQAYQVSANCKLELKFAQQSGVLIVPAMMNSDWKAAGWLGLVTAGMLWTPFFNGVEAGVDKLIVQM